MNTINTSPYNHAHAQATSDDSPITPPPLPAVEVETETTQDRRKLMTQQLPKLLRWLGGISLIAAAITFLLRGWVDAESLTRYFSFYGLTVALTGAGLFCALRWKEDKGARTFLALAAALIPAHFAQLGAMVYAEHLGQAADLPGRFAVFQFSPVDTGILVGTIALAIVTLTGVAYTGFSAMARAGAKRLSGLFLATNALLLLPMRDGDIVAGIAFLSMVLLLVADRFFFAPKASLNNWDGLAMRTLLFAPVALLMFRSIAMYELSGALVGVVLFALACVFFIGTPRLISNSTLQHISQFMGASLLLPTWLMISKELFNLRPETALPLVVLPWALSLGALSFASVGSGRNYRRAAALFAVGACVLQLFNYDTSWASVLCIIISALSIVVAFVMQEKGLILCGAVGLVLGLGYHMSYALTLYREYLWVSLALTGIVSVLAGSFIERHWQVIGQRTRLLATRWKNWA